VDAPVAGGLGERDDAQLVEHARLGIEVEAQLVGVVGVGREVGPHVKAEAGQVDGPGDVGDVGGHQRLRRGAVDGADGGRLQPVGDVLGHPLLEEVGPAGAFGEALHQHRARAHRPHEWVLDGEVVAD
jgi:hypothetical protein